ncbi:MAG TPA: hypothetical protein VFF52_07705 [Isosphaeraceae bacterium]|nr:hypothetical protein [Isosphaeraceae bacterium]
MSNKLDHLFADFVVVCRHVIRETPGCFVLMPREVRRLVHRGEKNGKVSYWLQPRDYAADEFREKWERIGSGLTGEVEVEVVNTPFKDLSSAALGDARLP